MNKPVLVIMAAGMGSRYGGLKQIDPIDAAGHIIMDFSLFDARKAGFEKVVFIIKEENYELFKEVIGDRVSKEMEVAYVFQKLDNLPEGFAVPEGRVKPWGTGHAVLCAAPEIDGPFVVINADDYYGRGAFEVIYDYLTTHEDDDKMRFAMVSYMLGNTLTENGHVARGVCTVDENGFLADIVERTKIIKTETGAAFSEDDGETWTAIDPQSRVSMNMWGFSKGFMDELKKGFPAFLEQALRTNPLKGEYYIPSAVDTLLNENRATVEVLRSEDRWYGVTYKEDREMVVNAIAQMEESGKYPKEF